ncbi:hypothetical protein L9F63_023707, partial [Diploptera punctata]
SCHARFKYRDTRFKNHNLSSPQYQYDIPHYFEGKIIFNLKIFADISLIKKLYWVFRLEDSRFWPLIPTFRYSQVLFKNSDSRFYP